jgi:hypothetical protein
MATGETVVYETLIDRVPAATGPAEEDTRPVFVYTEEQEAAQNFPASSAPGEESFRPNPLGPNADLSSTEQYNNGRRSMASDRAIGETALEATTPE